MAIRITFKNDVIVLNDISELRSHLLALAEKAEEVIFQHTSTIGIRKRVLERTCMERENKEVQTPYGPVAVKQCRWKNIEKSYPEYESVKAAAERAGVDFRTVFMSALQEASK